MIIVDEPAFMGRKSGDNNPVMDGLVLWFDAQDELVDDRTLLDRVSGSNISASGSYQYRYTLVRSGDFIKILPTQSSPPNSYYFQLPQQLVGHPTIEYCISVMVSGFARHGWFGHNTLRSGGSYMEWSHVCWNGIDESGVVNSNVPFHVISTWEGDRAVLYVNGEKVATGNTVSSYTMNYIFQLEQFIQSQRPDGVIDIGSVRIYNRPLTADEVLKNYTYEQSLGRVQ